MCFIHISPVSTNVLFVFQDPAGIHYIYSSLFIKQMFIEHLLSTGHYVNSQGKWGEVAQSCPTLCDPMDGSPPGSSIHGIFQARVLEWGAIAFSEMEVGMPLFVVPQSCGRVEGSL